MSNEVAGSTSGLESVEALGRAFDLMTLAFEAVEPAMFDRATRCDRWDLRTLLGHIVGVTAAFAAALDGNDGPIRARADLDDDPATQFRQVADQAIAGWRRADARAREYPAVIIELDDAVFIPPIPLPGDMFLDIQLLDTRVHVLDVGNAIGARDLVADDAVAAAVTAAGERLLLPGIRELVGFGEERPAPHSASAVERLLAFTGRE